MRTLCKIKLNCVVALLSKIILLLRFGGNMSTNEATVRVVKLPVTQLETV